jgi:hypothetical protein
MFLLARINISMFFNSNVPFFQCIRAQCRSKANSSNALPSCINGALFWAVLFNVDVDSCSLCRALSKLSYFVFLDFLVYDVLDN